MGEDDGSRLSSGEDSLGDDLWAGALPVEGIDRPEDDLHAVFFLDRLVETGIGCSVGRTHEGDRLAGGLGDCRGGVGQFVLKAAFAELVECFMVPAVIGDFMPLGDGTSHDFGMLLDQLTEDEEGRVDMTLLEDIEKAWGQHSARSVVEGHGYVGTIDADRIVRGAFAGLGGELLGRLHGHSRRHGGRCSRCGDRIC